MSHTPNKLQQGDESSCVTLRGQKTPACRLQLIFMRGARRRWHSVLQVSRPTSLPSHTFSFLYISAFLLDPLESFFFCDEVAAGTFRSVAVKRLLCLHFGWIFTLSWTAKHNSKQGISTNRQTQQRNWKRDKWRYRTATLKLCVCVKLCMCVCVCLGRTRCLLKDKNMRQFRLCADICYSL